MKPSYIKPHNLAIDIDSTELFLQSSDEVPGQAYNQYSSDDACAREQQSNHSHWDNEW